MYVIKTSFCMASSQIKQLHTRKRDYIQCFALMTFQSFGLDKKISFLRTSFFWWTREFKTRTRIRVYGRFALSFYLFYILFCWLIYVYISSAKLYVIINLSSQQIPSRINAFTISFLTFILSVFSIIILFNNLKIH